MSAYAISETGLTKAVVRTLKSKRTRLRKELTKAQDLWLGAMIAAVEEVEAPAVTVTGSFDDRGFNLKTDFLIEPLNTFLV